MDKEGFRGRAEDPHEKEVRADRHGRRDRTNVSLSMSRPPVPASEATQLAGLAV